MNDLSKLIITELAGIQKAGVDECRTCIGEGITNCSRLENDPDMNCEIACNECEHDVDPFPCPDCAEIRALDLCWHEFKYDPENREIFRGFWYKCKCGLKYGICTREHRITQEERNGITMGGPRDHDNPDLTTVMHGSTLLLVHWLKVLGVWGEFYMSRYFHHVCFKGNHVDDFVAEITDGELLCQAVWSWLQEREDK